MKIVTQVGIIFSICWISQIIEKLLPFSFPASVIGMILLFILSDMAEQERRRIGILRAIGASKGGIRGAHVCLAMREGLRTLGLANAAFALVLLGCAFVKTGFHTLSPAALVSTLSEGLLWKYPWKIHLLICLGAWLATTLLRALPYRRLCKMSVIATKK